MHSPLLLFSLLLLLPLVAASSPPLHHLRLSKSRLRRTGPPQEYIQLMRPLPFDSLTPSCTLPLLSHSFANTINLPPTHATYSPPPSCTWTNAVLLFSAASNGSQYDRIAAVWLSGAELLRTSTPEPTEDGIFWNFRKDVTRYSSLLRRSDLNLTVMLENVVNDVYTGIYRVNLTLLYYDISANHAVNIPSSLHPPNPKSRIRKLKNRPLSVNLSKSLELNENPADLIIPISTDGDGGFWFRINGESDAVHHGIKIPQNTYRAVMEVYVSYHGNDEFWYSNPPDYYIETNNLPTQRGHGAYRQVFIKLDNNVVGSVVPFPVVFTGGINPLFWEPVVSIGAFDLPSYEIELTPFLGTLLDGKLHYFGLGVADAISFWLLNANLHLWLDDKVDRVQAGPIRYFDPGHCIERDYTFEELDGQFGLDGESRTEFSGWVNSSAGNFTTYVSSKIGFENTITFKNNGTIKKVEQEVKVKGAVELKDPFGTLVSNIYVERKYPLKMKMKTMIPGSGTENYLVITELDHSLTEDKKVGQFESKLQNKMKCRGWMFVEDNDVLLGAATTDQTYEVKDGLGCYSRKVLAENGGISTDTEKVLCAVAAAAS